MAKWIAKAIVQKTISVFPFKEKLNHVFQKHITKGVQLTDEHFGNKLMHAADHIKYYKKYRGQLNNIKVLELGSGWYPVVPIALYLSDAGQTDSLDIQSWMNKETIMTTITKFKEWNDKGKLKSYLPEWNEEKWKLLLELPARTDSISIDDALAAIQLKLHLKDARNTGFQKDSYDFICSNNTFEHIYGDVLINILREFKLVAKPGAFMCHFIDLSDHFAHFDHSINIYNFLKFSPKGWKIIDNTIQPQNRLRWKDYLEMYRKVELPVSEEITREGDLKLLSQVKVHKSYQSYSQEELAISHGYILSEL
ncbi:class I SAM-dependent methyltransferase [Owenweeksia hongkongensis]|uniref:class I SAM-dependent methyltransferase n=1 Tax=Owenweeksia hongkongensis TaxID=253245 RepID=UPI003A924C39